MGEKSMYICMCNWVPMLYNVKKNCVQEITIKNKNIKLKNKRSTEPIYSEQLL